MARIEADFHDQLQRQQLVGAAVRPQRAAVHVLHHEVGAVRLGHRVVDLHDVRVLQPADERGLGIEETLRVTAVGRVVGGHAHALDRHVPVVELVMAKEDFAGRAFAELAKHAVLADLHRQSRDVEGGRRGSGENVD